MPAPGQIGQGNVPLDLPGLQDLSQVKIKQFAKPNPPQVSMPTYGVKGGQVVNENAPGATTSQATPIGDLLSAILGGQQGEIPQGYANFFTQVIGPMMQAQSAQNAKQLASIPGVNPNVLANLTALNQAAQTQAGPAAQGLQQFTLGPLANAQKLIQTLTNALSFLPYSASGIGTVPSYAADILNMLGTNLPATSVTGVNPTGAVTGATPTAPQLGV